MTITDHLECYFETYKLQLNVVVGQEHTHCTHCGHTSSPMEKNSTYQIAQVMLYKEPWALTQPPTTTDLNSIKYPTGPKGCVANVPVPDTTESPKSCWVYALMESLCGIKGTISGRWFKCCGWSVHCVFSICMSSTKPNRDEGVSVLAFKHSSI